MTIHFTIFLNLEIIKCLSRGKFFGKTVIDYRFQAKKPYLI